MLRRNEELRGMEFVPETKLNDEEIQFLKDHTFRWSRRKQHYWAVYDEKHYKAVEKRFAPEKQIEMPLPKAKKQTKKKAEPYTPPTLPRTKRDDALETLPTDVVAWKKAVLSAVEAILDDAIKQVEAWQ